MSSILASVRKNRYTRTGVSETNRLFDRILNHAHVVPVDVCSVIKDCIYSDPTGMRSVSDFIWMSRLLPPFEYMWLEGDLDAESSVAWSVIRWELTPDLWKQPLIPRSLLAKHAYQPGRVFLFMSLFYKEHSPAASEVKGPQVTFNVLLNNEGAFIDADLTAAEGIDDKTKRSLWRMLDVALHSLLRMNCVNARLEPTAATRANNAAQTRGTVWHEIKIGSPGFSRPNVIRRTKIEIRCCWVRGHYADYTKGRGLFANPRLRAIFWMPEHERGNPQVGEVVSSYRVVSSDQAEGRT